MTEKQEFRDFLTGLFRDFILNEAKTYLAGLDAFRLDKREYRTSEELAAIEASVRDKAKEMSRDFLDELEVKGISNPEDYEKKWPILEKILQSYREKLLKWLREL